MIQLAEQYIEDVLKGRQVVGKKARQAVERHINDLDTAKERGWRFNETEAEIALTFISCLRHTKGEWAKKPFQLQPFQAFIIYAVFGWQQQDDNGRWVRRFRKAYIRMARKNGKSELAAAIALYMLIADAEPGAEVYSSATILNQARKVFDPAAVMMRMLKNEDREIAKAVKVFDSKNNCLIKFDDGEIPCVMVPLSMDVDTSEGSSPHCQIIDEYHLHKTTAAVDVGETGMGGRSQPLLLIITTAGFDISLPCYEYEMTALKVLEGEKEIDRSFVMIFDLDDEDDWKHEATWVKANPGVPYGFPSMAYLRDECQKAQAEGFSKEKAFRVKNCNQWLSQSVGWIPEDFWKASQTDFSLEEMKGRRVWVGLDLARTRDLASLCLLFPPEDEGEKFRLYWKHYAPGDLIDNPKRNEGKINYRRWEKMGLITRIDGNIIDDRVIFDDIMQIDADHDLQLVGFDRKFAYAIIADLTEEDITCSPIQQNSTGLTVPIFQAEALFFGHHIETQQNDLMLWEMGNVVLIYEDGDHVRISKKKSPEKIDGVAAMLDAFAAYMNSYSERERVNIFDLINARLLVK